MAARDMGQIKESLRAIPKEGAFAMSPHSSRSPLIREAIEFDRALGSLGLVGVFRTPDEVLDAALHSSIPMWLTVTEAARIARVGCEEIHHLIDQGRLRTCRFDGKIRVSTASLFGLFEMTPPVEPVEAEREGNGD
jgi:hypothetical protein